MLLALLSGGETPVIIALTFLDLRVSLPLGYNPTPSLVFLHPSQRPGPPRPGRNMLFMDEAWIAEHSLKSP